jgi:DNA polymerase III subunit chi
MPTKVIIFPVKDSASKVSALYRISAMHVDKKEKLKILVPDQTTLEFVDRLLWNEPKESFLPHSCGVPLPFQDFLYISLALPQIDDYGAVFNLCSSPCVSSQPLKIIYEFEDLSHPQKRIFFQNKFNAYQKSGFILCSS